MEIDPYYLLTGVAGAATAKRMIGKRWLPWTGWVRYDEGGLRPTATAPTQPISPRPQCVKIRRLPQGSSQSWGIDEKRAQMEGCSGLARDPILIAHETPITKLCANAVATMGSGVALSKEKLRHRVDRPAPLILQ